MTTSPDFVAREWDESDASLFFNTLFGAKPKDGHILIWTNTPDNKTKVTRTFTDVPSAIAYASSVSGKTNVYVGVGLGNKPRHAGQRYKTEEVSCLVALWADIDIADEKAHKKNDLPPNLDEAVSLVRDTGLTPTLIVHSGHGIQAWWLFDQPWVLDTTEENRDAYTFAERWHAALKTRAKLRGYNLDSVFDLARVLRVPGTVNMKSEPLVPVTVIEHNPHATHAHEDFVEALKNAPMLLETKGADDSTIYPVSANASALARKLKMDPNATPPHDKWAAMAITNPDAHAVYNTQKVRGPKSKQLPSPSETDWFLAKACLRADPWENPATGNPETWNEQEITNLLISCRRLHNSDLKLRADYYARTIERAREEIGREEAQATRRENVENFMEAQRRLKIEEKQAKLRAEVALLSEEQAGGEMNDETGDEFDDGIGDGAAEPDAEEFVAKPVTKSSSGAVNNLKRGGQGGSGWQAFFGSDPTRDTDTESEQAQGSKGPEKVVITSNMTAEEVTEARGSLIAGIDTLFRGHLTFVKLTKLVASPPLFSITLKATEGGDIYEIPLGEIEGLTSQRGFRNAIAAYTSILVGQQKSKQWEDTVQTLLSLAETEDIGEEATEQGLMRAWLVRYIEHFGIERTWEGAPPDGPFKHGGEVCIKGENLVYWLRTQEQEKISPKILGKMLRDVGASTCTIGFTRDDGTRSSRAIWRLPKDFTNQFADASDGPN